MNGGTLMYTCELLAQCSCGGGNTRISIWAVLLPGAAVFLCLLIYDRWTRKKAIDPQLQKPGEPDGEKRRDEE